MILSSLASRRAEKAKSLNGRLLALQQEVTDADEKLKRLYGLVENGLTDLDEVLKDRLKTSRLIGIAPKQLWERAKEHLAPQIRIDPALIEQFGRTMSENFRTGSVPFARLTFRPSSTLSKSMTASYALREARNSLRRPFLQEFLRR